MSPGTAVIGDARVLAVVPARGGSKGIPLKNLRSVGSVPLVARVGQCVAQLPFIDRAVVSTDHPEIKRVAEQSGLTAPFTRPAHLSGDRIGDWDVLHNALMECERLDAVRYDIILMLQPTSPMRRPSHVQDAAEMLASEGWDAVWTVSETDSKAHPLKQLTITDDRLSLYDKRGDAIIARQQLSSLYHRNGLVYAFSRACLVDLKTILPDRTAALLVEGHFVSIDTEQDIAFVEFLMARQGETT
jgi:CMP-N-acetylneuraminic acid synthetase